MATFSPLSESCGDWKHIKCSRDELRLDVTLASGQSFRLESCHSVSNMYLLKVYRLLLFV